MSEKQVDRGLMAAAKWLVSRPNTKKIPGYGLPL